METKILLETYKEIKICFLNERYAFWFFLSEIETFVRTKVSGSRKLFFYPDLAFLPNQSTPCFGDTSDFPLGKIFIKKSWLFPRR